jgi:fructosamine-3-kinase
VTALAQHAAALLGGTLSRVEPLAGGDLSQVLRITLRDGRQAVVKGGPDPCAEAAMLREIAAAGAPAPAVLAVDGSALVLEALRSGGRVSSAWPSLGAALARLHTTTGASYGWDCDYAFGKVAIENQRSANWPDFWAGRRLLPHLPHLPAALSHRVEALARDCAEHLPDTPPAALLHGDLWGGNVLVSEGELTGLIDPACYYGHGEVDIAMLGLFDNPARGFFDAYGELEPGADTRLKIYRLWPVLVHVRLFGTSYRAMAEGLLSAMGY